MILGQSVDLAVRLGSIRGLFGVHLRLVRGVDHRNTGARSCASSARFTNAGSPPSVAVCSPNAGKPTDTKPVLSTCSPPHLSAQQFCAPMAARVSGRPRGGSGCEALHGSGAQLLEHGPQIGPQRIDFRSAPDRSQIDPKWTPDRPQIDPKSTQDISQIALKSTPSPPQLDPNSAPDRSQDASNSSPDQPHPKYPPQIDPRSPSDQDEITPRPTPDRPRIAPKSHRIRSDMGQTTTPDRPQSDSKSTPD